MPDLESVLQEAKVILEDVYLEINDSLCEMPVDLSEARAHLDAGRVHKAFECLEDFAGSLERINELRSLLGLPQRLIY